ncbi:MAG: hypothetical protein FWD21_02170, partial [Peptococcaceae bacterium]|nr:hypothetical protein [Peptococcaceae bacterium]
MLLTLVMLFTMVMPALAVESDGSGDNHVPIIVESVSATNCNTEYTEDEGVCIGSTTVVLFFVLSDGSTIERTKEIREISGYYKEYYDYEIECCEVTVAVEVETDEQPENSMIISGVSADIDELRGGFIRVDTTATCEESGETSYTCFCGIINTEEVLALEHDWDNGEVTDQATCDTKGRITFKCLRLGCEKTRMESIQVTEHVSIENFKVTNSTPTYSGSGSNRVGSTNVTLTFSLSDGTTVVKTEAFARINSTKIQELVYSIGCYNVTVAVTVTARGTNNNMIIDGANVTIKETELNGEIHVTCGHNETIEEIVKATCTEDGYEIITCLDCDEVIKNADFAALGHDEVADKEKATCTEDGYEKVTCKVCGEGLSCTVFEASGHDKITETMEATCTEDGYNKVTCANCDFVNNTVIKASHSGVKETVDATCTDDGYIKETCLDCNEVINNTVLEAKG